ncbi:hypothetical protein P3T76_009449 [Phytophthora citrophthora]|uniref:Uncharacterized protein n=1 Tax=Phytophthora citrophthora TaxID=4793 RepID=A0AAD9GGZ8_9STRA|nr:hypothetical protein P3T76_009449 [Phytophthora citrophthora]
MADQVASSTALCGLAGFLYIVHNFNVNNTRRAQLTCAGTSPSLFVFNTTNAKIKNPLRSLLFVSTNRPSNQLPTPTSALGSRPKRRGYLTNDPFPVARRQSLTRLAPPKASAVVSQSPSRVSLALRPSKLLVACAPLGKFGSESLRPAVAAVRFALPSLLQRPADL